MCVCVLCIYLCCIYAYFIYNKDSQSMEWCPTRCEEVLIMPTTKGVDNQT